MILISRIFILNHYTIMYMNKMCFAPHSQFCVRAHFAMYASILFVMWRRGLFFFVGLINYDLHVTLIPCLNISMCRFHRFVMPFFCCFVLFWFTHFSPLHLPLSHIIYRAYSFFFLLFFVVLRWKWWCTIDNWSSTSKEYVTRWVFIIDRIISSVIITTI